MLDVYNHQRDAANLTYIYPVLSRRAGGISVGINLNINRKCNWACVYCQVENLQRGNPESINLTLFQEELNYFLNEVINGNFLKNNADKDHQKIVDLAFSGDGEPTATSNFSEIVTIVLNSMHKYNLLTQKIPLRLITNGSFLYKSEVQNAISLIGKNHGEVWFKIDRFDDSMKQINKVNFNAENISKNLQKCLELSPTWIQTCWFEFDNNIPTETQQNMYINCIKNALSNDKKNNLKGILLYAPNRKSYQQDGVKIKLLSKNYMEEFREKILQSVNLNANSNFEVKISF